MSTIEDRYQKWKNNRGQNPSSSAGNSIDDQYIAWQIQNRGLDLNKIGKDITGRVDTWLKNHNNYLNNYNNRFGSRKGDFTDGYVSDARDYLGTVSQQARNFDTESNAIRGMLDQYGRYFNSEWVENITKALDDARKQQGDIRKAAASDVSYWSQFKDEDAYKSAQLYDEQSKADLPKIYEEIEAMKAQADHASKLEEQMLYHFGKPSADTNSQNLGKDYQKMLADATAQWGDLMGLKSAISERQAYYNTAKRIQDAESLASVVNNQDFKTFSGYESTEYGDDEWYSRLLSEYGLGYDDVTHEYINGDATKREEILQGYGKFAGETADFDKYMVFDNMKDTEIATYNYYYNKEGKAKAEEYLDSITQSLNYRAAEQTFQKMKGNTLAEVFFGVEAGADQFQSGLHGLWNAVTGNDEYVPATQTQALGGMIREDLADDGFKVFGSSLGQMAYDFLSTTTNMAPSLLASTGVGLLNPTAGAAVGAGLLGAGASGNAYTEMINQGYTKSQAGNYAMMIGASEAGLSYLLGGIGKLGGKLSGNVIGKIVDKVDNVIGRVAIKLGGTMIYEGMEEGLQEILTPWFQSIATDIEHDVNWEEAAYSALLGAVTGLVMEGPGVVSEAVTTAQAGNSLQQSGVTAQELADIGMQMDINSTAFQLADRVDNKAQVGDKVDAYTMGRMWNEIGQSLSAENTAALSKALQNDGMGQKEADTLANAFAAVTAGKSLTKAQQAAMKDHKALAEAVRTTLMSPKTEAGKRMQAYNKVQEKLNSKAQEAKTEPKAETKVSGDGKAHVVETGESVEKLQIKSLDNGNITYKVGDRTVDMDGVEYATQQEAVLHDAMSKTKTLNVRAANFMAQNIDPNNPGYAREAIDSYQAGWYGYSESKLDSFTMPKSQSFELYAYGKKAREEYDAKQKQAQSEAAAAAEAGKKAKGTQGVYFTDMKGKTVVFDDANQRLSKAQKAGVDTAKFLNELGLGGEIVFFRSQKVNGKWVYEGADGKYHAAQNGMYTGKDGRIYIDLNTFAGSRGATLYTLSHELTHFIENNSPEQYKILSDFLINEYDKTGKSMDERVKAKQAELEYLMDGDISYDDAFREVVADSMQKLFNDGNLQNELVKLKQTNPEGVKIVQAIKDFLDKLLKRIRDIYSRLDTGSEDAEAVAQMGESLEKLQKIFAAALVEASDNYTAYGAVVMDTASESQYSTKNDGKFMAKAIEQNTKAGNVAESVMRRAQSLRAKIADRMNAIREAGKIAIPEDIEGNTFFGNSSYDGSEENTTICPRSLAAEAFVDAVSELMGRPLTVEEQIYISQDLQKPGRSLTPECTYCYVATDRKAYRAFLGEYVKQRDSVIEAYKNGNTDTARSGNLYQEFLNGRKDTDNMWKRFSMWINTYKNGTPMVEASHLASMEKLMGDIQSEFGKELKAQIKDAMAYAQSASWAKKRVGYVAYNGHILKWKQDRINKLNSHYGLRMYSFSDFSPAFILENMQMITDAAVRGLKMLGYTKELDFVKIFAPSGMNINISTFGFERAGNVYENNIIGANWEEAKALREKHPNVGITFVATNDTLVEWALEQDWIDVVIPYHLVRTGKELARKLGFTDYTGESADVKTKDWKPGDQKSIAPTEHNNDKATYLEALQKNHLRPRFERYIDHPNYMKLVNECRQSASESKPVQPIFNETAANESLAKLEANGYYQPIGGTVDRMYEIASDIADDIANGRVQFQAKPSVKNPDKLDPRTVTKTDVLELLNQVEDGHIYGNTYIPIRINTPATLIYWAKKRRGDIIDNNPIAISADKAYNAMNREGEDKGRLNRLSPEEIVAMVEGMNDPQYIVYQEINDRYVEVVEFGTDSGDKAFAVIEIGNNKDSVYMNGYEGGLYNILVTTYPPKTGKLTELLRNSHNDVIYDKKKDASQRTSSSTVPSVLNDASFYEESIPEEVETVKQKDSSYTDEAIRGVRGNTSGKMQMQTRPSEETSNRYLLANALESAAQTDAERQKLQQYRAQIQNAENLEDRLDKLNRRIFEVSFAPGPRDTAKLNEMRETAKRMARQLDRMDQKLLGLEATKPMRDLLERERKLERQRTAEKYQDTMKQRAESRQKTEMRHKVQKAVKKLNDLLLHESKDKHIPDRMKKAVADILDSINMDTVEAESRIRELEAQLNRAMKAGKAELVQDISRRIDNVRNAGDKLGERIKKLHEEYEKIRDDTDPVLQNAYDEGLSSYLMPLVVEIGDTPLRSMTIEQLQCVYDVCRAVAKAISEANKTFLNNRKDSVRELSVGTQNEVKSVGGEHLKAVKALTGVKQFGWSLLKPVYAMRAIGSQTMTTLFNNIRKGEDVWAVDVNEAKEFYREAVKKYGYDGWDLEKQYTFRSTTGREFQLNLEQIMSLYALSRRDQALEHLQKGGFVYDSQTEVVERKKVAGLPVGIPVKYTINTANAYNMSMEILADVVGTLSKEQQGFVEEMQSYLSNELAQKGNAVSMALYDLRLFKEKNYFPLRSADQYLQKKNEPAGHIKLKNAGFSKKTTPRANNPIVLGSFTEVWSEHVNDMSMYHAFVLPIEDFNRVYNFNSGKGDENVNTESVKGAIQNAYGSQANKYISKLLEDINGGARNDPDAGVINKLVGLHKKGAVYLSASVVVQQPSAIARAEALIDPVYFAGPKIDAKGRKATWEEVKKWAPIALIKEMGRFDMNMGKSTVEYIKGKEYTTFGEQAAGFFKDKNYRDDVLSRFPALADEVSWCYIWNAVKRETAAKNRDMVTSSTEFLQLAGERFTEVITRTQVYDSVLSRSQMMRSKDTGVKMITAFYAEPNTSMNMAVDAVIQHKRGVRGGIRRTWGAILASQVINSLLVSAVYAARDDDDDETYLEKYAGRFVAEVLDGFNPMGYLPVLRDILSVSQGYTVERSDMSVIGDIFEAVAKLSNKELSVWKKTENLVASLSQFTGIPVKNLLKDANAIYNTFWKCEGLTNTTALGVWNSMVEEISRKDVSNARQLYSALMAGDDKQAERVIARYKDSNAAITALQGVVRDEFEDGKIDATGAAEVLIDYAGLSKEEAETKVSYWNAKNQSGTDLTLPAYTTWYMELKNTGITLDDYEFFKKAVAAVSGENQKQQILQIIHQMRLTNTQKDALYYACNYAASTLQDAPWH